MIEIYLETKPKGDVKECNGKEIGDRFWDVNGDKLHSDIPHIHRNSAAAEGNADVDEVVCK